MEESSLAEAPESPELRARRMSHCHNDSAEAGRDSVHRVFLQADIPQAQGLIGIEIVVLRVAQVAAVVEDFHWDAGFLKVRTDRRQTSSSGSYITRPGSKVFGRGVHFAIISQELISMLKGQFAYFPLRPPSPRN